MTPESLRSHINGYLELRRSLGFQTTPVIARDLHKLLDYVVAKGFSWPIRTQTILDWISAVSPDCGLGGQRLRLINARNARARRNANAQSGKVSAGAPMVRCAKCGVYLPRSDAVALTDGFACAEGECAKR